MERTQANDRARRFIASVCAYGFLLSIPMLLPLTCANAASRWSDAASQEPAAAVEEKPAAETTAPNTDPAPAETPATPAAPATTAAPAMTTPVATATITDTASALPPTPGLRRLPPVSAESAPRSVAETTTPVRIPPAAPIDWRRPSIVMGPLPGEASQHHSQVRLISDVTDVTPASAAQPTRTPPLASTSELAAEIMPAHTTPENGATPADSSPIDASPKISNSTDIKPASSTTASKSRYAQVTKPAVETPPAAITPRYAAKAATTALENPAESTLKTPTEKPHFARVTDESMSSPAPKDGLSPIYVCRLLGLRAAKK